MGSLSLMEASEMMVSIRQSLLVSCVLTPSLDNRRHDLIMPGPDELAGRIHRHGRLFPSQLYDNSSIIVTDCDALLASLIRGTPRTLQAVVERLLKTVRISMPYPYSAVLGSGNDHRQLRVIACKGNIVGVALEGSDERLGRVVPDLDCAVVGSGEEIRLVGVWVVVDGVDALALVRLKSKVGHGGAETPNFDSAI